VACTSELEVEPEIWDKDGLKDALGNDVERFARVRCDGEGSCKGKANPRLIAEAGMTSVGGRAAGGI